MVKIFDIVYKFCGKIFIIVWSVVEKLFKKLNIVENSFNNVLIVEFDILYIDCYSIKNVYIIRVKILMDFDSDIIVFFDFLIFRFVFIEMLILLELELLVFKILFLFLKFMLKNVLVFFLLIL